MKKITQKITILLTAKEVVELNELIGRDTPHEGLPTEDKDYNKCPNCGRRFNVGDGFCSLCGVRLKYNCSDTIPL